MSDRCHNDPLDTADDVCDSCYGSYCSDCLVILRTKPHPICKDCALILSGVRGTRKPKIIGDKRTVKQRREELKEQTKDPKFFTFFDENTVSDTKTSDFETVGELQDIVVPAPIDVPEVPQGELSQVQELEEERDLASPDVVEEFVAYEAPIVSTSEVNEEDKNSDTDTADNQAKELDAIEEFDLGLETTSVKHKKNERMTFTTQVEDLPKPEPKHVTIEQLAAAKEQPVVVETDLGAPKSPKDYIKLGIFDKSVIDLVNASYSGPKKKLSVQKIAAPETRPVVEEKTPIRQQIDAIPEPPSHRRLHQKENTAEVPAVLNNVHPSELQREETFEACVMPPEAEKVEAFAGAPAEEIDPRGVYVPPALRGKEYNTQPLPKRRREEG